MNLFYSKNQCIDSSGSSAIIILIINDSCYIANLGDSRALYSADEGIQFFQLSRDHKPNDPIEKKRIYKAGGSIYKANIQQITESSNGFKAKEGLINLPYRIYPGRLSVSYFLIL
jgi:protein phosphatase 2C family protein 2/3